MKAFPVRLNYKVRKTLVGHWFMDNPYNIGMQSNDDLRKRRTCIFPPKLLVHYPAPANREQF